MWYFIEMWNFNCSKSPYRRLFFTVLDSSSFLFSFYFYFQFNFLQSNFILERSFHFIQFNDFICFLWIISWITWIVSLSSCALLARRDFYWKISKNQRHALFEYSIFRWRRLRVRLNVNQIINAKSTVRFWIFIRLRLFMNSSNRCWHIKFILLMIWCSMRSKISNVRWILFIEIHLLSDSNFDNERIIFIKSKFNQ